MNWTFNVQNWLCQLHILRNKAVRMVLILLLFPAYTAPGDIFTLAFAASKNESISATATVNSKCLQYATGGGGGTIEINFDTYDAAIANETTSLQSSSSFQMKCTKNTTATVMMDNGLYANGVQRRMTDGQGNYLNYRVYQNAGMSLEWDESSTLEVSTTTSAPQTIPVYADVPPNQDVPAGTYYDTIVMTTMF